MRHKEIQPGKTGDAVCCHAHHRIKAEHRRRGEIVPGKIRAAEAAEHPVHCHGAAAELLPPALAERGEGDGKQVDAAQKQGKHAADGKRVPVPDGNQNDFENQSVRCQSAPYKCDMSKLDAYVFGYISLLVRNGPSLYVVL